MIPLCRFYSLLVSLLLCHVGVVNSFVAAPVSPLQPIASSTARGAVLVEAVDDFYNSQPYLAALVTCSFKASAADFFAQRQGHKKQQAEAEAVEIQRQAQQAGLFNAHWKLFSFQSTPTNADAVALQQQSPSVDIYRNAGFIVYGGLYQGLTQEYLFNNVYPALFPTLEGWSLVAAQVAFDMMVVSPLLCLPLAYISKALFTNEAGTGNAESYSPEFYNKRLSYVTENASRGLAKYVSDVRHQELLLKYWALWIPVQSLTFGVIPPAYRVAFVAAVSFVWVFVLSSIAANQTAEGAEVPSSRQ